MMKQITRIALCVLILSAAGCYGWEYPKLSEIRRVESTPAVTRMSIIELSHDGEKYLGKVIEVHGIVGHIVNKGGQPGVSLIDLKNDIGLSLFFGPKEKRAVERLVAGEEASFRGLLTKVPAYLHPGELRPAVVQ